MSAYIRNQAGTAWLPLTTGNLKYRKQDGSGWANATESGVQVRYPQGIFGPFLGEASVNITGMSVSALTTMADVTSNGNHQLFSNPPAGYGMWCDGFPNPYRDGAGNTYLPIPHSENFRFKITDWNNPAGWIIQNTPQLVSARVASEGSYNNRHWIFGHWASGNTIHALCHHEWYVDMVTSTPSTNVLTPSVPGFNANNPPTGNLYNQRWVNAITHATSTDGGASFSVAPYNDSRRCVLIPEPWGVQQRNHMFGFFHPTNIVKEGNYYYAAVEQRSLSPAGSIPENGGAAGFCADSGMSLIRTLNPAQSTGWEFWNGSGWTAVSHSTYQGNLSSQKPHRFFPSNRHNFYAEPNNFNSGMGHSIRYHVPSGKWVFFGFTGSSPSIGKLGYAVTSSLANPSFGAVNAVSGSATSDFDAPAGRYFGVFDPNAVDQNFVNIGNSCIVLVQRDGVLVRKGTLNIFVS